MLAAFVSSMGLGSLAAKPLLRRPAQSFVAVEAAVALIGGLSAMGALRGVRLPRPLRAGDARWRPARSGCSSAARSRCCWRCCSARAAQAAGASVADLLAADYLGAVVAGVSFPFLLLPWLGQIEAALAIGALNAARGARRLPARRALPRALAAARRCGVLVVLGDRREPRAGRFEVTARQSLFDDPIVLIERSHYQEIVLTQGDGRRPAAVPQRRPAVLLARRVPLPRGARAPGDGGPPRARARARRRRRAGDARGAALPRTCGASSTSSSTRDMIALARDDDAPAPPEPRRAARPARADRRRRTRSRWLRGARERFDVVDRRLPRPRRRRRPPSSTRRSSTTACAAARSPPAAGSSCSPARRTSRASRSGAIEATMRAAGLAHDALPRRRPELRRLGLRAGVAPAAAPALRARRRRRARRCASSTPDARRRGDASRPTARGIDVEPSTLNRPRLLDYQRRGYRGY